MVRTHSVFLYVDPFTVEGIDWEQLVSVMEISLNPRSSVEILINFNTFSFVRRGLSALGSDDRPSELETDEHDDTDYSNPADVKKLNTVVGGDWWQEIMFGPNSAAQKVVDIREGVELRLKRYFSEVCSHSIFAKPHHTVPKYDLIFGSAHPDALLLMNEEMIKSRDILADMAKEEDTLFETRSESLVPDTKNLPDIVLAALHDRMKRKALILSVVRNNFGVYSRPQIRGCIESQFEKRPDRFRNRPQSNQ